jgi:hypothetical protein
MAYTQQESYWPTPNSTRKVYVNNWVAQGWTPQSNYTLGEINVRAYRVGYPGTIYVQIKAVDGDGLPTGPVLSSGSFNGNDVTINSGGQSCYAELTPFAVSNGVTYAIILYGVIGDANNCLVWKTKSAGDYDGGILSTSNNGINWSATSDDGTFQAYSTPMILIVGSSGGILTLSGSLLIEKIDELEGTISGELSLSGLLTISSAIELEGIISGQSILYGNIIQRFWINNRPNDYDPEKVYDEETSSWIDKDGRGGSRFQHKVVVVNDLGEIFVS